MKALRLPDSKTAGKASAYVVPQLWQPRNGILMANDVNDNKTAEEYTACIAVYKNGSYMMSASGGKVSLFNMMTFKVETKLKGHRNRITGLAFSQTLNILVCSGADAQLCVWSIFGWEKKKTRLIQAPTGRQSPLVGETKIQFHNDHTQLLVAHESQIAVYDSKLDCLRSWTPKDALAAPISWAIYSCDGLLVYATFCDGVVVYSTLC
ncbi:putative transcription factor WD40-like family [Rosa chinensis]|uniref:Putative transcription factor WD40-like family n=1 Tax=Rosa chinensis TaxID=74649 RepID=A0A2P6SPE4_ROSCH|nr:putative transcription factor WD40-like family [Rosa chinensis]